MFVYYYNAFRGSSFTKYALTELIVVLGHVLVTAIIPVPLVLVAFFFQNEAQVSCVC